MAVYHKSALFGDLSRWGGGGGGGGGGVVIFPMIFSP